MLSYPQVRIELSPDQNKMRTLPSTTMFPSLGYLLPTSPLSLAPCVQPSATSPVCKFAHSERPQDISTRFRDNQSHNTTSRVAQELTFPTSNTHPVTCFIRDPVRSIYLPEFPLSCPRVHPKPMLIFLAQARGRVTGATTRHTIGTPGTTLVGWNMVPPRLQWFDPNSIFHPCVRSRSQPCPLSMMVMLSPQVPHELPTTSSIYIEHSTGRVQHTSNERALTRTSRD
jgi:hypothetical protein